MKRTALAFTLVVASLVCQAQSTSREESFLRIERSFKVATLFTADSPMLVSLLQSAKSANPSVSETDWRNMQPEFATSITSALRNDGGSMLRWLHASLDQLTDAELERMAEIYEDPVFAKSQKAMSSAAAQQEAMRRNLVSARLISVGINSVLSKHGLKEAQ
jgi:hypothetical protein